MENVQAFGVFQRRQGNIFRKSAYLQWGMNKRSIGSFLLLNPGRAKPARLNLLKEGITEKHKVDVDPTMKQMAKLVKRVYNKEGLNGRVHIYNLFSLRNPKNEDAILNFEQLVQNNVIDPSEDIPSIEEFQNHPWICCGWGINSQKRYKHLQHVKTVWKTRLQESGVLTFGKLHKNGIDYYHLRPRLIADQEKLIDELLNIFQAKINIS